MKSHRLLNAALLASVALVTPARAQVGKSDHVDPNLATKEQLLSLPHMNDALAKSIIERRPFLSMLSLDSLLAQTLSKDQRAALYQKLWVHLNLNTATRAEILLIPGVGARMAHEFEEYRPYKALAQFHREIRKYVDENETNRLEGYVFVPIDLNTASDSAILTIPGVGNRMLHEFKEYRPYDTMAKFRREIGKYVSPKEVARFERYVTITK
jgi:DNA uptake protein ComE-like DNA-binding protein